jgi:hypothetical protein
MKEEPDPPSGWNPRAPDWLAAAAVEPIGWRGLVSPSDGPFTVLTP